MNSQIKIAPFGSATEEAIRAFEERFALKLPNDYREMLKVWNGGFVKNGYFPVPGLSSFLGFTILYGRGVETMFDIEYLKGQEYEDILAAMIPIAHGPATELYLACTDNQHGIYLFDVNRLLDESDDDSEDPSDVLYYVCRSVTELFGMCKNYRDAVLAWGTPADIQAAEWDENGDLNLRRKDRNTL
jgi:hypothetical protein